MKKPRPSLPSDQAFVVQFYDDVVVDHGQFFGRVEHVVSGKAARFDSVEALVAFITRLLTAQKARDDESGST